MHRLLASEEGLREHLSTPDRRSCELTRQTREGPSGAVRSWLHLPRWNEDDPRALLAMGLRP